MSSAVTLVSPELGSVALPSCVTCSATDTKLSRCATCHIAKYCSQTCQRADWPKHKLICPILGEVRDLFSSPVKTQKLFTLKGIEFGILFNPEGGDTVAVGGFRMRDSIVFICEKSVPEKIKELVLKEAPVKKSSELAVGKSFNGQPIFQYFGFK